LFSISLIIPTLNAANELPALITAIAKQTIAPDEIFVVDSSSDDNTVSIARQYDSVQVLHVDRNCFNHGTTRHKALLKSKGDLILFLTQDALPLSDRYIENLVRPFSDKTVALTSGRQIAKDSSRRFEQLVRTFNYPSISCVRSQKDLSTLGIKTFFASDVCSAYRRSAYLQCGGFERPCNTNEDMLMAAAFIHDGWKVAYAADAEVSHSHDYTFAQQYNRNKEIGFFLEKHASQLVCGSELAEGKRLSKYVVSSLLRERNLSEICVFSLDCLARITGNRRGRFLAKKESFH
jgi:rhamnosyltransferase